MGYTPMQVSCVTVVCVQMGMGHSCSLYSVLHLWQAPGPLYDVSFVCLHIFKKLKEAVLLGSEEEGYPLKRISL